MVWIFIVLIVVFTLAVGYFVHKMNETIDDDWFDERWPDEDNYF